MLGYIFCKIPVHEKKKSSLESHYAFCSFADQTLKHVMGTKNDIQHSMCRQQHFDKAFKCWWFVKN